MKIKPFPGKLQLDIEKPKVGGLDISGVKVAKEKGTILAINSYTKKFFGGGGEDELSVGDTIYFKSWAVDIIEDEGETLYFIDVDSKGLCAVVK